MFSKVLIANRGAIATRIIRTLDRMGVASVAVYSEADRHAAHVAAASEAVAIGPPPAAQSYLNVDAILAAARETGAQAVHPGYGFLSENPDFAEACEAQGIRFIGPKPEHMRAFGLKHQARDLARAAGVPLAPGSGLLASLDDAREQAGRIGYPVMLKSTAGGGGIGLQLVSTEGELSAAFERVERLARNNFKDGGVFLEKFVARGRHIEVQIFGDGSGNVLALGERDCSAQRRNQKVIEETPAPGLSDQARHRLWDTAVRLGQSVSYDSAGTVEFLYDSDTGEFYFLEVNTRLQVEHGVTEEVLGVDLVEWMIRQAAGELTLPPQSDIKPKGASIQVRLYAEDPGKDFQPSSGLLTSVSWPKKARIETWIASGTEVTPFYDPMLAKIICTGEARPDVLEKLRGALTGTEIGGIETNLAYLRALAASDVLARGEVLTRTLADFDYQPETIDVVTPGTQTTVQDWPGRVGYWNVGVPPSGPMDNLSFRLANRIVGNDPGAPGLEITLSGPVLKFNVDAVICIAGAQAPVRIGAREIACYEPVTIQAGETLSFGTVNAAGARMYLAIRGGLGVPSYLGSAATFTLGRFGGHGGRALLAGDVLHIGDPDLAPSPPASTPLPEALMPGISGDWEIGVLDGPHGAPDFFTGKDIETFFETAWEVHYNSNRTGVRLIGPKPEWAREDGGEAGLHPSNIHDNAYAIGAVDFTGDMPVILGPDGPSLGGFVCPVTIASAELWKMGQLRAGDKVRFKHLTPSDAQLREQRQLIEIQTLTPVSALAAPDPATLGSASCIVGDRPAEGARPRVVYRRAGDKYLLIEYGPIALDLELRFRVHVLMMALEKRNLEGILDLTPGIRSLQVHYESLTLPLGELLDELHRIEDSMGDLDGIEVPSRIVRLPLSWDDAATQLAIDKYIQSVRADAPWCPSNIEFIRRINGLDSIEDVKKTVTDASYLVLGLGDVYLGAPVATPVDPRHRLVTTKYNPARTWTPENAVGIGGAYLCVYGMEGPGGYQFVGRTCQVWNTYRNTREFVPGSPWLLRFFDQIRFHLVTAEELLTFREDFLDGTASLDITDATFSLKDYRVFLTTNASGIADFKARQQEAFEAERARWQASDQSGETAEPEPAPESDGDSLPEGMLAIQSPVPGSVWKLPVEPGARVKAGDVLVIVESMKMELAVTAPQDGILNEIRCAEGRPVALGQTLVVLEDNQPEE